MQKECKTVLYFILFLTLPLLIVACHNNYGNKVVICIPVYGQSLALGEEAERITDFDSLSYYSEGRIVTENLDHHFGYFDNNDIKAFVKKNIGYQKRAFELSIYNMACILADSTGSDTIICIFPGGQGATALSNLSKGSAPYEQFISNIKTAHDKAVSRGWSFCVPAICWMQGESDIADYPDTDYQDLLQRIWSDMNSDILNITQQEDSIPFVCYQANSLTRAAHFNANSFQCRETAVPQSFVNLLCNNMWFWASGPTYPYSCISEKIHIDAIGQQAIGALAAKSVLGIIHGKVRNTGLTPKDIIVEDNRLVISFNIPVSPLVFDTEQVNRIDNYGFSVINKSNANIIDTVTITNNCIMIRCKESPHDSMVRYAVNGDYMKSGRLHGPRGNLRDSDGNWCYQFDLLCP